MRGEQNYVGVVRFFDLLVFTTELPDGPVGRFALDRHISIMRWRGCFAVRDEFFDQLRDPNEQDRRQAEVISRIWEYLYLQRSVDDINPPVAIIGDPHKLVQL